MHRPIIWHTLFAQARLLKGLEVTQLLWSHGVNPHKKDVEGWMLHLYWLWLRFTIVTLSLDCSPVSDIHLDVFQGTLPE